MILTSLLLVSSLAWAYEGPLQPPTQVEGQYVYTVPQGARIRGVTAQGMDSLNEKISQLHHPMYVIITDDLPRLSDVHRQYARDQKFRGKQNEIVAKTVTEYLRGDMADANSYYDPMVHHLLYINVGPNAYNWYVGQEWENSLGLVRKALVPYDRTFQNKAKRTKNPLLAAEAMVTQLDNFIFDQTDPARIEARRVAAERARKARELNAARSDLREQVDLYETLLESPYAPEDTETYAMYLDKGRILLRSGMPAQEMAQHARMMGSEVAPLEHDVSENRRHVYAQMFATALKWGIPLSLLFMLVLVMVQRYEELQRVRAKYHREHAYWSEKLRNAELKWSDFYMKRESLDVGMKFTGDTESARQKITESADNINVNLRAMRALLDEADKVIASAKIPTVAVYQKALALFEDSYDFDTGKVDPTSLFTPFKETISMTLVGFADHTEREFRILYSSFDEWLDSRKAWQSDAETDLAHDILDKIVDICAQNHFPADWYAEHPLAGDDESDKAFWDSLNALRRTDPMTYLTKVEELRTWEDARLKSLQILVEKRERVARLSDGMAERVANFVVEQGLPADQDPTSLLRMAERRAEMAEAAVASAATIEQATLLTGYAGDSYLKISRQMASLTKIREGYGKSLVALRRSVDSAQRELSEVTQKVDVDASEHAPARKAAQSLKHLQVQMVRVARDSNLLDPDTPAPVRDFSRIRELQSKVGDILSHLRQIDRQSAVWRRSKEQYLKKVEAMVSKRSRYNRKLRSTYSTSYRCGDVTSVGVGAHDYAYLLSQLNSMENKWDREYRRAKSSYENGQAAQAAARRRSSSYSSSGFSGGGGSFGGGGFSGGGGSFGGGGFSGGGGSW